MSVSHVAVLETIAKIGGAQISLLELIRSLQGRPRVTVILPEDGPLRSAALAAGAEVRILSWPAQLMRTGERSKTSWPSLILGAAVGAIHIPRLGMRLSRLLAEIDADALVTNGIKAHVIGAMTPRHGAPLVWYLRDLLEGRSVSRRALRALSRRCSAAVAISHCVASEARLLLPATTPLSVIYNIVDFERFRPAVALPQDLVKAEGEIWFGVIGAITPLKGQDVFLKAAALIAHRVPQARFVIVGSAFYKTEDGRSYEETLHRLADDDCLRGRVLFLAHRLDMPEVMNALDVLVQPNRGPEALGRAILEAMACGVAVISVDRWGPGELISDGETGLLTAPLDIDALADRMLSLAESESLRRALAERAFGWVKRTISAERIAAQFRSLLLSAQ